MEDLAFVFLSSGLEGLYIIELRLLDSSWNGKDGIEQVSDEEESVDAELS